MARGGVYRPKGSHNYKASYKDRTGKWRSRWTGTCFEDIARHRQQDLQRREDLARMGVAVPELLEWEKPARKPAARDYAGAVASYLADVARAGRGPRTVKDYRETLTFVGRACGWGGLADVTGPSLTAYLARRHAGGTGDYAGKNDYWRCRHFTAWCVRQGYFPADPLAQVERPRKLTKRRPRRAFTPGELETLIALVSVLPRGGPGRALAYAVLAATGLRKAEGTLLTRDDYTLPNTPGGSGGVLHLAARKDKTRRCHRVALTPDAARLLEHTRDWEPKAVALPGMPAHPRTLNADLGRAGLDKVDARGLCLDFHSFRYTFCSNLARAGVPIQVVQQLMRHQSITQTVGTYLDLGLDLGGYAPKLEDTGIGSTLTPGGQS